MAHPARPPARHPPNPSIGPTSRPAPPPSPTTPAARRPDTPRRAAQDTPWAPCVDGSRNSALSQCKQDPRHNQIHQANEATSRTKGIVEPDSSDKLKTPRFSGGTYSKPDARVKLIPAEDITYLQHRKQYGRAVGSAGLQKRHCRRSVTPPPNSRKVSLVGSTSLNQSPKTSASSYDSCLSRKGLDTAENRRPFARGHISSSVTPQITSLKNPASPSCKSSQPLSTDSNTDGTPRNLDRMGSTKALARSSNSNILNSQGQSSQKLSASLPKGATINPVSSSPKQMRAPHPSEDPVCTKAEPSFKSLYTPESGKLCSRNIIVTTRSTTAPGLEVPTVGPALLSPTSVLSERPIEVCPDTRTAAPVVQEPSVKPVLLGPIPMRNEYSTECNNIPPIHSAQSTASMQHGALLQERNSGASIDCSRSSGAPVILHTKLHKKHRRPEGCWKGNFHVTGELFHTCDGLEAHLPSLIYSRVYDASKHMPETLNLEAVSLSQLWPEKFKMEPPDGGDIGLWFVSSHERPDKSLDNLLGKVASHTGLVTKIGDTELAIFSSELLLSQDQRKNGELYFWGVFGKHIRKKRCQPYSRVKNVKEVGTKLDVTKGRQTENTESDIGMALGARGNPTVATGNKERVRDNYEDIAKVLDFTGGKETGTVNDCMAVLGTPDSNPASSCSAPAASLLNGCCSNDSANKSTFSLEDSACQPADRSSATSDLMLDIPPGFSLVPPGFTKAHCQPQIVAAAMPCADAPPSLILDTPPGFPTDIHPGFTPCADVPPSVILDTPPGFPTDIHPVFMPCADVPPSLILDTPPGFPTDIPPGFTEAHRIPAAISFAGAATRASIPGTEKKPLIKFSLNVPRPVKMEVPPGFTAFHAVKKEPGLPAVDKATEKQTLNYLASTASSMGKAGKADEMEIMDNEVKVEQDENSEEREFPKIRRLVDLYPSDSAEFSQPASLPDKFQERAPEKQIHQRKRGRDESPEPAPADTTSRWLNVNGRIAFNNSAGQGNGKVTCICASPEGRAVLPTRAPGLASSGDHLDSESISLRCVVCGEEFPAQ